MPNRKRPAQAAQPAVPYTDQVEAFTARLTLEPTPVEADFYRNSIDTQHATAWGARHESGAVLDDFLGCITPVADAVIAGRIPGYGPLRFAYACGVAHQLASAVKTLDESTVAAAGSSEARSVTLRDTQALRRQAKRALRNLAGARPDARRRVAEAARDEGNPDDRSRSLAALAAELEHVRQTVPERVAADAGATPELIAQLRSMSSVVLDKKGSARDQRGKVAAVYDTLNELDGRVLHEVQLLVGAVRDARRHDPTIPACRSRLVRKGKAKKPSEPAAPPTPAPTA